MKSMHTILDFILRFFSKLLNRSLDIRDFVQNSNARSRFLDNRPILKIFIGKDWWKR